MAVPVVKIGSQFLVNTQTSGDQSAPDIVRMGSGNFIVVWQDTSGTLGDSSTGIKAQIFAADGGKVGSEFLVNTQTGNLQSVPTVTRLSDGGAVITWQDLSGTLGDGSGTSIKAQILAPDGSKVGSEFLVNSQVANFQQIPDVTSLSNGGFVVTWQDLSGTLGDASGTSIKAQVFAADGTKVGSEFLVNTTTTNNQTVPSIAGLENGGFVASWQTVAADGSTDVKAQIFAADGSKVGSEFYLGDSVATAAPVVTGLAGGGFVVAWQASTFQDVAVVFRGDGTPITRTILVGAGVSPTVGALSNGDFVIVYQDQDASGLRAQVFRGGGTPRGDPFTVDWSFGGNRTAPAISLLDNGGFAVVWQDGVGSTGDGSGTSIKAQLYFWDTTPPNPPIVTNPSVVAGVVNAARDTPAQVLKGTAEADSVVTIYLNGTTTPAYTTTANGSGAWTVTVGLLADGNYSYTAIATDNVGNQSAPSAPLSFVVDTSPPVLDITSILSEGPDTVTLNGIIDVADAGQVIKLVDAANFSANFPGAWTATVTADASGHWSISGVPWSVFANSPAIYAYDAAGNLGLSHYVYAASQGNGAAIGGGDRQNVHGMASGFVIASGAMQNVYADGWADGTVVRGAQIDWGVATNTRVDGGAQYVWGFSTNTTISSGAQYVGGTAASTSIAKGAQQTVYDSGSATATTVIGGSQYVWGAADQTSVQLNGVQDVYGSATGTSLYQSRQYVRTAGIATGTMVYSASVVENFGTTVDMAILSGGMAAVRGTSIGTTINGYAANMAVFGTATGTLVGSGGWLTVEANGTANDTTINGGSVYLSADGAAHGIVFSGPNGFLSLTSSSSFSGTISGFQSTDYIVLRDVNYSSALISSYVANGDSSGGTLTVSDGVHSATLALLGQYAASDFTFAGGQGGVGTYVKTTHEAQLQLATPVQS